MPVNKLKKILFVPDSHHPYVDQRAWNLMMKSAQDLKPEIIVCIGDLGDFFSVSSFDKSPRRALQLDKEIKSVNNALDELDNLGAKKKIFCEGNHEDRLRRYLQNKAPELFEFIDINSLLHLNKRKWKHIKYKESTRLGKLFITHDIGSATRYNVYRVLDTFQHSVVTGHTHRFAYIVEGNAAGEYMISAQFGWLGDLSQVDYLHQIRAKKDWSLGFAYGNMDKDGNIYVVPVPIVDYKCVVKDKLYVG